MSKAKYLYILFFIILIKSVLWPVVLPVFQTPDEQAHFAQLQWYAETKNLKIDSQLNLSKEVYEAEVALGTNRDIFGNNKFTYHPEYKNPITGNLNDKKLPEFNLAKETRTMYVGAEAAGYPPLYYLSALPFYHLFYDDSLISRVYASRIPSVLFYLAMIFIALKIGKEIWDDEFTPKILALAVAFHPMLSFVGAGIHPDNLLNLLSSIGVLMCLKLLKKGFSWKNLLILLLVFLLGMQTKQFMIFLLPIFFATFLFTVGKKYRWFLAGGVLLSAALAFVIRIPIPYMPKTIVNDMSIFEYLRFRLGKLFFEIWPWYWGVFRWLSLTLDPLVLKIITRIGILSGLGLLVKIVRDRKSWEFKVLFYFILASGSYLLYMLLWDWRLMQSTGFSLGLQGRYLFPLIVCHMTIFLIGLKSIIPVRFQRPVLLVLTLAMILLNFHTLNYLTNSYYGN